MKIKAFGMLLLLVLFIPIFGCSQQKPIYPNEVKLELITKNNLDLFQIEISPPKFGEIEANVDHTQYPWYSDVKVYYLGEEPLKYLKHNSGEFRSFPPLSQSKPVYLAGFTKYIHHDQEKLSILFEWEIDGSKDTGELVYKIIANY
jgi:hypothetical protein